MRTIKFRVWDKSENEFIKDVICFGVNGTYLGHDDYLFSQFTGRLDKKDNEVYEGDIVQFDMPLSPKPQKRQIIYSPKYAAFVVKGGDYFPPEDWDVEVIGNIYENPELLN